ncbi:glycosyltransferase [Desulfovibrio sp. OttesenSCG-928-O18]|nr:glycosyltransferase [Desulfovibrio sp. OttesenSCG-928-O18]
MAQISVVWVGNPFFQSALADCGWKVHHINPSREEVLTWDAIMASAGFVPDILVVADKSQPPFVVGMERFPCLTAFYAVDTHIHSWYPHYAQAFDICLLSLRDHVPLFAGARLTKETVWWSPPYANPKDVPVLPDPEKPFWDVLFLGTVNPDVSPQRSAFLDELAPLVPGLHVATSPNRAEMYAQAKIVLNHAVAGDLNFRVFEALGCGACLVTPIVRHGFDLFFENGIDLFTYDQNDIPALAKLLNALPNATERCKKVALHGHATVLAGHYMRHRAEAFAMQAIQLLASGKAAQLVAARLAEAKSIHNTWLKLLYLHHAETAGNEALGAAYLKAARG